MNRPSWTCIIPVAAAGALGAVTHTAVSSLATGDDSGFFVFTAALAGGIGLFGSAVGFAAGQITRLGRLGRLAVTAASTFAATLAVSSIPGVIGGLGRALFVTAAAAGVLAFIEWQRSRSGTPQAS